MQCVTEPDQRLNSWKNGQICRKYQMPSLCLRTYILFPCKEESLVHKKSYYCKVVLSILVKFFIKIKVTITLDLCITTLCTYTTFLLLHGPHCSFLLIVKHQEHISWFSTNPTFTYFSLDINAFSFLILVFLYFLTVYFPKQHWYIFFHSECHRNVDMVFFINLLVLTRTFAVICASVHEYNHVAQGFYKRKKWSLSQH